MAFCIIGRNVYRKKKKEWIGYAYPVFAMLGTLILQCTVNMFLLFMAPLFPMYQKTPELIMLVVNFAVCIFLVLKYSRYDIPYDAGRDRLMFWMTAFLHIYAMVSILVLGITKAILPCAVVAILHGGYLFFAYRKIKAAGGKPARLRKNPKKTCDFLRRNCEFFPFRPASLDNRAKVKYNTSQLGGSAGGYARRCAGPFDTAERARSAKRRPAFLLAEKTCKRPGPAARRGTRD